MLLTTFSGYTNVATALLEKIPYTMDDLSKLDHHGDTALQSALAEGAFKCVELLIDKLAPETTLLQIEDVRMDNLVLALVLSSNVPYNSKPGSLQDAFEYSTLKLLSRLLDIVMEHTSFTMHWLTRQNSARETDSLGLWLWRVVAFMKHNL
jgi:ankyrin repeat protein